VDQDALAIARPERTTARIMARFMTLFGAADDFDGTVHIWIEHRDAGNILMKWDSARKWPNVVEFRSRELQGV